LHMDFAFLGKKGELGETIPCWVVKEANSKMRMATMVPTKSVDQLAVKRVIASDQEPAIKSLAGEIGWHGRRPAEDGGLKSAAR
jgi:hypothetical protein